MTVDLRHDAASEVLLDCSALVVLALDRGTGLGRVPVLQWDFVD